MKLLFDQNLSVRLVSRLSDVFPGSSHLSLVGLERGTDEMVWDFARDNGFILVSKDSDFNDLGVLRGSPPVVHFCNYNPS
jgi:predicted nuclease of predicted toxin-antitoxin system